MPEELDSVELVESVHGWPRGTAATVVDLPAEGYVTVEIDPELQDPQAPLLDAVFDVPAARVRVTARHG
jgi:hypothetical protein